MPSLYDLLTSPDPQTEAAALQDALRKRAARGSLLQATGAKALAPLGQGMLRSAEAGQAGMVDVGKTRLAQALAAKKAQAEQAQNEAEQNYRNAMLGMKGQELTIAREKAATEKKGASAKASEDLRKEFQGLQTYKNTQTIAESYKKIAGTSETGPGDVSLIYSYMRMVDPGSTVREGEFATAANAGGIPDRIVGMYNRALSGEKLPPEIRQQFKSEAKRLLQAQANRFEETATPYRRLAEQSGVSPADVVLDLGLGQYLGDGTQPPGAAPAGAPQQRTLNGKRYEKRADGWYEVN